LLGGWLVAAIVGTLTLAPPLRAVAPADSDTVVVRVHTRDARLVERLMVEADVWHVDQRAGAADVLVTWQQLADLTAAGVDVEIDWEKTDRLGQPFTRLPGQTNAIPEFPCYRTVEETYASLSAIATAHPRLARWVDIGDSWTKVQAPGTGYDINAFVLGNQDAPGPKYPFVIIAAMHARELATAELATRFAESLASGYGVDPDATWILDHAEIHVVAQLNPDGRKKAETGLWWRKNVDNNDGCSSSSSWGVDLNRNSTFLWGGLGASTNACSETYRGPSADSEPETQAIETYLGQVFADQRGPALTDPAPATTTGLFISLHSYGGDVLFPWEATENTPSPNDAGLATLARKLGYLNGYYACQSGLGSTAGTTVDQAYGLYGVAAYTIEIGNSFFEPCGTFDPGLLNANLPALRYAAKAARRPYQDPRGPEVLSLALTQTTVQHGTPVTLTGSATDSRTASGANSCGTEAVQSIASAAYTVDVAPWDAVATEALAAADGTFSASTEALTGTIDTSLLAAGRHLVYVFATDAAGNRGVPTAVFLDVTNPNAVFGDGFESGALGAWNGGAVQ
jgi:murein tripeptide amidase MpaA